MLNRLLMLFLVVASGLSAADEGSITISTTKGTVKSGSDVTIEVIFTNTSKASIGFASGVKREDQGELDYTVHVRDSTSARAPETKRGHKLRTGEDLPGDDTLIVSSGGTIDVPPGGTVRREILLNRLYDLSKPGKYTIQVERIIGASAVLTKSNVLTVTIEN